ncbi:hypothetical protein [Roseibium sp. RKSG952]|uniref:hypothetical protein n=1 Tax=Roseibium sp. RKSG952 TaxID=2529384 RepID=UPI0012BC0391|nr:hypothetical protein [Roseibium sp. RKSG952]MTH97850.1 hypothetical protein [Roseibium sp. RKSG952]
MPSTVEKSPRTQPDTHTTEYPPERDGRGADQDRQTRKDAEDGTNHGAPEDGLPAVLMDLYHHEDHRLDGVSAYTEAARAARQSKPFPADEADTIRPESNQIADAIRDAYEDNGSDPEEHRIDIAT